MDNHRENGRGTASADPSLQQDYIHKVFKCGLTTHIRTRVAIY